MNTIELLQIRSFSEADKQKAIELFNGVKMTGRKLPGKIQLFTNKALATDLTICLHWDTNCHNQLKSSFAQRLTAALKHFGWISHSILEPMEEKTSCLKN